MSSTPPNVNKKGKANHSQSDSAVNQKTHKKSKRTRSITFADIQESPEVTSQTGFVSAHSKYAIEYPLHAYIQSKLRNADGLSALLKGHNGFNIESRDSNGKTLLELAVEQNDLAMVKVLVQHGANFDFVNTTVAAEDNISLEVTPLFLVIQHFEAIHEAANSEKSEAANYLRALNRLQKNIKEEISLDIAVESRNLNLVIYHSQNKSVSQYQVNQLGHNPLDQAIQADDTDIAIVLMNDKMKLTETKQCILSQAISSQNDIIKNFVGYLNKVKKYVGVDDDLIRKLTYFGVQYDSNKEPSFSFDSNQIDLGTLLDNDFLSNFILPDDYTNPSHFASDSHISIKSDLKKAHENLKSFFLDKNNLSNLWQNIMRNRLEPLNDSDLKAVYAYNPKIIEGVEIVKIVMDKKTQEDKAIIAINTCLKTVEQLGGDLTGIAAYIREMRIFAQKMEDLKTNKKFSSAEIQSKLDEIERGMDNLQSKAANTFKQLESLEKAISPTTQKFSHISVAKKLDILIGNIKGKKKSVEHSAGQHVAFQKEVAELMKATQVAEENVTLAEELESKLNNHIEAITKLVNELKNLKNNQALSSTKMEKRLDEINEKIRKINLEVQEITKKREALEENYSSIDQKFNDISKAKELSAKIIEIVQQQQNVSLLLNSKVDIEEETKKVISEKKVSEKIAAEKAADIEKLTKELDQCKKEIGSLKKEKLTLDKIIPGLATENLKESILIEQLNNHKKTREILIETIDNLVKKHRHLDTGFFRSIGNSGNDKILAKELARIKNALTASNGSSEEISRLTMELEFAVNSNFLIPAGKGKNDYPMSEPRKNRLEDLVKLCSERETIEPREKRLESKGTALVILMKEETQCDTNINEKEKERIALQERIAELKGVVSELDEESKGLSKNAVDRSNTLPPVSTLIPNSALFSKRQSPGKTSHTDFLSSSLGEMGLAITVNH